MLGSGQDLVGRGGRGRGDRVISTGEREGDTREMEIHQALCFRTCRVQAQSAGESNKVVAVVARRARAASGQQQRKWVPKVSPHHQHGHGRSR
jgi:hypothetical protein